MEDLDNQIESIRFQLKNMEFSFENMVSLIEKEELNNSGTQIKSLGIQMLNMGIQMINIGIKIPDTKENLNISKQLQKISKKINDLESKIRSSERMEMNKMNMGMNMNNFIQFTPKQTKKIVFNATSGSKNTINVEYGTSVSNLIKIYFKEIKKPDLLNKENIIFLFNGEKIDCKEKAYIENFFGKNDSPNIIVLDQDNLI